MGELGDGVALFEALSEIAPSYFDPSTIARQLGDNWALKSSNLRKLIRNLETYYHEDLGKTADWSERSSDIPNIARNSDAEALEKLFELVAAAAVICDNKGEFVQRIMTMSDNGQKGMKVVLERSLEKLDDYDLDDEELEVEEKEDEEEGLNFEEELSVDNPTPRSINDSEGGLFDGTKEMSSIFDGDGDIADLLKERDDLRRSLQDVRRELALTKSQSSLRTEELESSEKKLRALVEDLQDRLSLRQEELNTTEKELKQNKRALGDSEAKANSLAEQNALLADDLDVANAKAAQLRKAEATVAAYRKKLEGAGVMSLQMQDLEDQAADYLRQIMDLENDVKTLPGLQKKITELNETVSKLSKEKVDLGVDLKEREADVERLTVDLGNAVKDKDMYKEELAAAKESNDVSNDHDLGIPNDNSFASTKSISQNREKLMRLEIENERQKKLIAKLEEQVSKAPAVGAGGTGASSSEVKTMKAKISELRQDKEKLARDKEKLESYTKKTLAKFQEKYLVALQECKAKLKEKHDKIEALEMRNAAEKNAQKREERLLSSTIYELGLAIMQNRLKER